MLQACSWTSMSSSVYKAQSKGDRPGLCGDSRRKHREGHTGRGVILPPEATAFMLKQVSQGNTRLSPTGQQSA